MKLLQISATLSFYLFINLLFLENNVAMGIEIDSEMDGVQHC